MNAPLKQDEVRPELTIRRTFAAPRSLVYRMWSEGEHLAKWSCPTGFTIPFSEGEVRPGGTFRTNMRAPDGTDNWLGGTYREVVKDERLVFTHAWQDEAGNSQHETLVTVTFADAPDGGTRLTLHQAFFLTQSSRDGHEQGWTETLDSLETYLAKEIAP